VAKAPVPLDKEVLGASTTTETVEPLDAGCTCLRVEPKFSDTDWKLGKEAAVSVEILNAQNKRIKGPFNATLQTGPLGNGSPPSIGLGFNPPLPSGCKVRAVVTSSTTVGVRVCASDSYLTMPLSYTVPQ
jgi:hypothetical protein